VQNRSGANETDSRYDLRRNTGVVTEVYDREFVGQQREHRGTETDEHVGPQPGWLVPEFSLQPDHPAQHGCD
jgi:hypothetical protein